MKLVIQTQIRENYAAHNGFTGEYRWRMKGGERAHFSKMYQMRNTGGWVKHTDLSKALEAA